jgi:hypothetical protein
MPKFMHTSYVEPPQHANLYKATFPFPLCLYRPLDDLHVLVSMYLDG